MTSPRPFATSQRAAAIKASPTLEISALAAALRARGERVIAFAAGEPDLAVPPAVNAAAVEAIEGGQGRYTPAAGLPELKQAIAASLQSEGHPHDPSRIICCAGAKPAIFQALYACIEPGDEVLFPAPYWTSYPDICLVAAAKPVPVPADADQDFQVDPDRLRAAVTERTKAIILNSPNNPTGTLYSEDTLRGIAEVVREHGLLAITDDIYQHLVYVEDGYRNLLHVAPDLVDQVLIVNSLSKSFSMTGWRLGYAAGPVDLIKAMGRVQGQIAGNPNTIAQLAAITALQSLPDPARARSLDRRRRLLLDHLSRIPDLVCPEPRGAFYAFPDVSAYVGRRHGDQEIESTDQLARLLLEEHHVATVPGSAFGAPDHLRLTYCCSDEDIVEGVARIGAFLGSLT